MGRGLFCGSPWEGALRPLETRQGKKADASPKGCIFKRTPNNVLLVCFKVKWFLHCKIPPCNISLSPHESIFGNGLDLRMILKTFFLP